MRVLSNLERSGLLSKLEGSGLTLEFIEKNRLLSKAEDLGVLPALADRCARVPQLRRAALPFGVSCALCLRVGLCCTCARGHAVVIGKHACRGTPSKLIGLGIVLVLVAAAIVVVVPDNTGSDVAVQAAGAGALGAGGIAALVGGGFISDLQK